MTSMLLRATSVVARDCQGSILLTFQPFVHCLGPGIVRVGLIQYKRRFSCARAGTPTPFLDHVAFVSSSSMAYAEHLVEGLPRPEFRINAAIFADAPNRQAADFAHVRECFLTRGPLDHDNVVFKHLYV